MLMIVFSSLTSNFYFDINLFRRIEETKQGVIQRLAHLHAAQRQE